jgi:two-component system, NtrC family, response regulator AtoC
MPRPRAVRILVVEDDEALREILTDELSAHGHEAVGAATVAAGVERVAAEEFDVAVLDLMLPDGSGIDVLKRIADDGLMTEAIVLTGYATVSTAIEAMKLGAYDYLTKPTPMEELHVLVEKAAEKARLRRENAALKVQVERLKPISGIVTQAPEMQELLELVERVAAADIPVLIQGETGTGKELVARAIHTRSPRAGQPFVAINCSAVSENLLESELFGHERGAFTGAVERKAGLLEVADRGVFFLDEVGDIAPSVQVKLLRALETGEFLRVGGTRAVRTDVRVVSATHKDLRRAVRDGEYREDLYHRLNGVTIELPPLRDRKGDIAVLATHFLGQSSGGKKSFTPRCLEVLESYSWPGNVRELRMVVQRAAILAKSESVDPKDLLLELWDWRHKGSWKGLTLAEVEREYITQVLAQHQGHRGRAAKTLGIDPKTLYNKLKPGSSEENQNDDERDEDAK